MHHYPMHPGDYLLATCHLDPMHDLAYRRLLDYYYVEEKPIPLETCWVSKRIRLDQNVVDAVLAEFFKKTDDGWKHTRCDEEIDKFNHRVSTSKSNGLNGGRPKDKKKKPRDNPAGLKTEPKKTQPGSGSGSISGSDSGKEVQEENHCDPPTNGHAIHYSDDFSSFWGEYPNKTAKGDAWKAWQRIKGRPPTADLVLAVTRARASPDWRKDNGKFIPHPSTWLNGRRWEDEGLTLTAPQPETF